jgi:hypothetical protein
LLLHASANEHFWTDEIDLLDDAATASSDALSRPLQRPDAAVRSTATAAIGHRWCDLLRRCLLYVGALEMNAEATCSTMRSASSNWCATPPADR